LSLHATETGVKRWPDGPLGPDADFTFTLPVLKQFVSQVIESPIEKICEGIF